MAVFLYLLIGVAFGLAWAANDSRANKKKYPMLYDGGRVDKTYMAFYALVVIVSALLWVVFVPALVLGFFVYLFVSWVVPKLE